LIIFHFFSFFFHFFFASLGGLFCISFFFHFLGVCALGLWVACILAPAGGT